MKRIFLTQCCILLFGMLFISATPAMAASCTPWPDWIKFRASFINEGGRIIDPSTPDGQTTSEGQSYGLFFSLIANDAETFERILRWTENNLAGGDLTARLPAWQWGKKNDGSWGVLDANAASDADLWIAYSLAEAGRLWNNPKYAAQGALLSDRIVREETIHIQGLGRVMLPAPQGFHPQPDTVRLNPSYFPVQIMRRMETLYPESEWRHLTASAVKTIMLSSPKGFAPDWVIYKAGRGFQPDPGSGAKGSHNAIRVYLWAGMLAEDEPARDQLIRSFAPMVRKIEEKGIPPLENDALKGTVSGAGPVGFSAAMIPLLAASKKPALVNQQRLRITALPPAERNDNYFEQALTLFALGWMENRYRFARDGSLLPRWGCGAD